MRKATKLNAPQLPDLTIASSSTARHSSLGDKDDASWQAIKSWSENLLGSRFESVDDLANHISHLSSPATSSTSTSKQMLQKKLMQREMKERKKVNVSFENFKGRDTHIKIKFFRINRQSRGAAKSVDPQQIHRPNMPKSFSTPTF